MEKIIPSHEIREDWYVPRGCYYFSGRFFHCDDQIGESMADLLCDELAFHTCSLKSHVEGQKIGEEIVARSVLFGNDLTAAIGLKLKKVYKYYSLTNTEEYRQKRGMANYNNPRLDSLFERLGLRKCGARNYCRVSHRAPMEAKMDDILAILKSSWAYLFYQRRAEALGLDWSQLSRSIDMEEAEMAWHANYAEARRRITGTITDSPAKERVLERIVAMTAPIRIAGNRQMH